MTEFYEPMLYMSTPEHPNTMGALVVMKEPVDGDILRTVVEDLRVRFPYFYIKEIGCGNNLVAVDNELPMTVRNTWEPIKFNSHESNYHLAAWKYEGNRFAFEISHSITDGAGVLPYIKSATYLYVSRKYGLQLDPKGIRLPGDEIPISEIANPFAALDIDGADAPIYTKKPVPDFYRFSDNNVFESRITYVKLSEAQLMQYCRDYDGSPNAFFSVMFARAIRSFDLASDKTVNVSVAIDYKAILGNHDNYRMFANVIEVDFPKNRELGDLTKSCTAVRGQMMLQAQSENALWAIKQRKATYAKLDSLPLDMKIDVIAKAAGRARWSVAISYANSRSFGAQDPFIEEMYLLAEPGVADIICEISCINHNFFLAIGQTFASDEFIGVFLSELTSVGLEYEVMGKELFRLCGMEKLES